MPEEAGAVLEFRRMGVWGLACSSTGGAWRWLWADSAWQPRAEGRPWPSSTVAICLCLSVL